jgi:hypothetical protein
MAALARHQPDHPDVAAFRAEAAERYIRELVDTFPPLTAEQKSRLAVLLLTPGGDDVGT